jgi:hypothetical protein
VIFLAESDEARATALETIFPSSMITLVQKHDHSTIDMKKLQVEGNILDVQNTRVKKSFSSSFPNFLKAIFTF